MSVQHEYWRKKVSGYVAAEWSTRPAPFAVDVSNHLRTGDHVLELGVGAGQDAIYFLEQGCQVTAVDIVSDLFDQVRASANAKKLGEKLNLVQGDISELRTLELASASFDIIYAQLSLHYLDSSTLHQIISHLHELLKPSGILAVMLNSKSDPEYDEMTADAEDCITVQGICKRYFTVDSWIPFTEDFETILLDDKGSVPKDDAKDVHGLIRYIGRKI